MSLVLWNNSRAFLQMAGRRKQEREICTFSTTEENEGKYSEDFLKPDSKSQTIKKPNRGLAMPKRNHFCLAVDSISN